MNRILTKFILLGLLLLTSACSSLFYYPTQSLYYDPEKYFALKPEESLLPSGPKDQVAGWYFKTSEKKSKGTFVQFHGNAENLSSHYTLLVWVLKQGYNLYIFDYPGYGKSTGSPNPQNTVAASKLALDWALQNTPAPHIIYGHSLGGIIALRTLEQTAQRSSIKSIIIDASFDSYQKIAQKKLGASWLTWIIQPLAFVLLSDSEAPKNISSLAPIPLLFIHGKNDRVIPYQFSERLYKKASEPKKLWIFKNSPHGATFYADKGERQKMLLDYLNSLATP